ncbi:hypothetical protein WG66_011710 [Moniliophthora roreri]|nr:hypothetical protein WG66_011710 [Moniliophthora roreri]
MLNMESRIQTHTSLARGNAEQIRTNVCSVSELPGQFSMLEYLSTTGLVIEDAISGLKSGRNAGSKTLAVCTSTQRAAIVGSDAHPDYVVKDLTKVTIQRVDGGIEVTMDDEA